ncbi:uncharacterized protein RJT20DRAFT_56352 [Scheffersomyces xylosifermentans]|uniref:uncharacterized protein n=1 Tax=Scheffersomyces xylosifermentans TaxID=1304137 RepID=UPI00315CB8DA
MGLSYPIYNDPLTSPEFQVFNSNKTSDYPLPIMKDQQLQTTKSYICKECCTPISVCDCSSTSPTGACPDYTLINIKSEQDIQLVNRQMIINNIHCDFCSNIVGFKVVNFIPTKPKLIPLETYGPPEDNDACDEVPDIDLVHFKNNLISIENELAVKFERMNYMHLLETNQKFIGRYFLSLSRVKCTELP